MKKIAAQLFILSVATVCLVSFGIRKAETQTPIQRGHIKSPNRGQAHRATVPFTIQWELDSKEDVESQDLILSTDGGQTFNLKIAAYLPPQQNRLLWSADASNVTGRARLQILLRLNNGDEATINSDDFSILPTPSGGSPALNVAASAGTIGASGDIGPSFAGTGSCVAPTLPTLNYNLNHSLPCPSDYGGEPALAQDPNNASRFHTVTGNSTHLRSRNVDWGFSGSATARTLDFSGKLPKQDLTTEVGADGKVYVTALAETSLGASDVIMIFRSTDGGATFSPGVLIPKPPQIVAVDKPVITAHPTNAQILAITFQQLSGGGLAATWVGICKAAATGDLASASNWVFFQPKDQNGSPVKGWLNAHPLIDPVGAGSPHYWLFVVLTNDDFSGGCCRGPAGISVYKYQVDNATQALANNGNPAQSLIQGLGYPLWTSDPSCRMIEQQLRIQASCQPTNKNITKAAIDYCDPNAHRMYIPTLVNTTGYFADGLTSDLFVTVWTYTGSNQGTVTKRILPGEKQKYVACAVSDGHGRVWITAFITATHPNNFNNNDNQRAQLGAIAIDRITGDPGAVAYMSVRLPVTLTYTSFADFFMGDYVYTQAAWYSDPNNPGNVNGQGSRTAMPTWADTPYCSSPRNFNIQLAGWN